MAMVRSMPPGQQRQNALKEIGRSRFRMDTLLRSASSSQSIAKDEPTAVAKCNRLTSCDDKTTGSADFVIDERLTGSNTMQRFVVYRCPNTGMNVQASFVLKDGDEPEDRSELYETANCSACGSVHLVNRSTGKLLREKIDKWFQPPKPQ